MAPSPFDDENTPLYTVGQVAEMLAVKQAFLRRVDDLQVVSPQRSPGGQRRYTRYEIRIIQQVVSMADEGITLQAIRRIIELEHRLAVVTRERDELARRLAALLGALSPYPRRRRRRRAGMTAWRLGGVLVPV
jgi:MerR family transcriptional regulator/heat shock protein HspR